MQRGMSEAERQALEEADSKIVTREHWELDLPPMGKKDNKFETVDGISLCLKLKHGRMSFGGYNKATERLMYERNQENQSEEEITVDTDASISEDEMAERYSTLIGTVAKRFKSKKSASDNVPTGKGRKPDDREDYSAEVPAKIQRTSDKSNNKRFLKPVD